ncbi:hypothetical protein IH992_10435 [Candidatus Poribacteria bacterium]|nr:hypothetical protein [Candidatus Poribacteria bacterium]
MLSKRRDFIRLWAIMNGNLSRGKIVSYTLEPFFMLSRVSAEARNFTLSGYAKFRLQDYPHVPLGKSWASLTDCGK